MQGLVRQPVPPHYEVELENFFPPLKRSPRLRARVSSATSILPENPSCALRLPELVKALKSTDPVTVVSLQTNGTLLDDIKITALAKAGLDRVNLSLHAVDPMLARELAGVDEYDINKVMGAAMAVAKSSIDLLIAPVYMPGINDAEIPKLIDFAKACDAGKRFPPLGIQKFERYKYGRTPKGVKVQSWWQFFNRSIKEWEKASGLCLRLDPNRDFGTFRRPSLPQVFKKGEKATVEIMAPGWIHGEMLGIARNRVISVYGCDKSSGQVRVRIVATKNNIYIGVPI